MNVFDFACSQPWLTRLAIEACTNDEMMSTECHVILSTVAGRFEVPVDSQVDCGQVLEFDSCSRIHSGFNLRLFGGFASKVPAIIIELSIDHRKDVVEDSQSYFLLKPQDIVRCSTRSLDSAFVFQFDHVNMIFMPQKSTEDASVDHQSDLNLLKLCMASWMDPSTNPLMPLAGLNRIGSKKLVVPERLSVPFTSLEDWKSTMRQNWMSVIDGVDAYSKQPDLKAKLSLFNKIVADYLQINQLAICHSKQVGACLTGQDVSIKSQLAVVDTEAVRNGGSSMNSDTSAGIMEIESLEQKRRDHERDVIQSTSYIIT